MPFSLASVSFNADGWGPPAGKDIETIGDIPFAPFSKSDRFGRVADWTAQGQLRYQQQQQRAGPGYLAAQANSLFAGAIREEEEAGFLNVEAQTKGFQTRKPFSRPFGNNRYGRGGRGGGGPGGDFGRGRPRGYPRGQLPQRQSKAKIAARSDWMPRRQFVHRNASVEVRPNWKIVHQFAQADLSKLDGPMPDAATDLKVCGVLETYDNTFDRVAPRVPVPLQDCSTKTFHSVTTTEDPIVREMAVEETTGEGKEHRVFATDAILAAVMASARSVNSWDLSIEVLDNEGSKIVFLDKRDDFDLYPVNETSTDPPGNAELAISLSEELALVCQRLSQQVLKKGVKKVVPSGAGPNPFAEKGEDVASSLYKYRKWKIDKNTSLIARCQLDGVMRNEARNRNEYYNIFSLNEVEPRITDWKKKLETAPGAVLATEIKNNACTLAKWAARGMLSGAEVMKLGYVCRSSPNNRMDHLLFQVQQFDPVLFARQNLSLNPRNAWAIVRKFLEICVSLEEGKYILLKDPNKQFLHLYAVPPEAEEDLPGPGEDDDDGGLGGLGQSGVGSSSGGGGPSTSPPPALADGVEGGQQQP